MLKGSLHHPIRAEVIGIGDREELGQVHPTLMHPALHLTARPIAGELPRCTWNRGGGLQRQPVYPEFANVFYGT
jgi:hypothetical protein